MNQILLDSPTACQIYSVQGKLWKIKDTKSWRTLFYQDNKSAITPEKNGKSSSSKRNKHTNSRFFFITGRISKKEFNIEWCPTNYTIVDFMTKPT